MMNIQRAVLIFTSILISGCATPGAEIKKQTYIAPAPLNAPAAPTYSEKARGVTVDQVKSANCPQDNKWENLTWTKIIPLANACVKAKDWHRVEKMGDLLAKTAYLTPWGAYYLSVAAEARKDYPRALWMLELALKKNPNEGIFHYEIGRIQWELKDDAEALKHLKMASDLNSSLTGAHWIMGQMAIQRQDYSAAEHLFEKALESDSEHMPSIFAMAQVKVIKKEWERAEEYLAKAVRYNPRSTKARLALAQVQEEYLKKVQEALHGYKQLKQLSADRKLDESVHINLDEKIQSLEKNITQMTNKVTTRQPSTERQVKQ